MTEDGNPMDEVEILNAMRNVAKMAKALYSELVEQGFTPADALALLGRYLHGAAGGKIA